MPGDYSPRSTIIYDCGHRSQEVERSLVAQRALDIEYMRAHGYPDYMKPWLCPACAKEAKVSA